MDTTFEHPILLLSANTFLGEGEYRVTTISKEMAKHLLNTNEYIESVPTDDTAKFIEEYLDIEVEPGRRSLRQYVGQLMISVRPTRRPKADGSEGFEYRGASIMMVERTK